MEAGHDVKMVEGYRMRHRQRYLFSIGRTIDQGKPVVTDVQHSKHEDGLAMDVCSPTLGYEAPALFDWLWENAPRFGLRTLRGDRGHIEEVD
jgi:LAS superfamily LD-carboxypeptidase LdcB